MYGKIKQINDKLWEGSNIYKLFLIIWIIISILSILFVTVKKEWPKLLMYPEEAYQSLEDEAKKMADTHNLETDYDCIYTYNNVTKSLSLNLQDDNVTITAEVSDYHTDKQDISITRNVKSNVNFIFANFIGYLIAFPGMLSMLITIAIIIILALILLVTFIFHKIGEKIKQKE